MTNEEMEKIINFLIQRQEVFSDNMDRMQNGMVQMQDSILQMQNSILQMQNNMGQMQQAIIYLTEAQTRTQEDISHLSKVVTGLVNGRNGNA